MKTGLVLEGGGMRGLFTAGVLDVFLENGISFDYIVGVSAGACNGASYVSRQLKRNLHIQLDYIGEKRYASLANFIKTRSIFGMDFIFDEIPNSLNPFDYEAFSAAGCEYLTGVTDVLTGSPVYFDKYESKADFLTKLRASSSIPVCSPMVEISGRKYLDGGTSDPRPMDRAFADGCDKVVVVLTKERGFSKPPERFRLAYKNILRKYPNMIKCMDERHIKYNEARARLKKLAEEGRAFVCMPESTANVGRFEKNREKLVALYKSGVNEARGALGELRAFLAGDGE
jgi:predicted patatin/cPLA2 family phospholipase